MIRNNLTLFTTAVLCLLAVSCGPKATIIQSDDTEPLTTQGAKVISIVPGQDSVRFSELIKSVDIIPLQTSDESLINEIRTIKYDDGMFFVFDYMGKSILKFDMNGQFKGRIGNRGRGRGEYLFPNLMGIDRKNRTILVGDNTKYMLKYTYDGEFISSADFPISASDFEVTDDSYIFYTGKSVNFKPGYEDYWGAELMIIDRNNTDSIRRYIPVDKELYPVNEGHTTITDNAPLTPLSDSYTLHYNFTDYIFSVDCKSGAVKVKYVVDYGKNAYTDNLADMPAMDALQYIGTHPEKTGWTHQVIETDALLTFMYAHNKWQYIYFNDKATGKTLNGPFVTDIASSNVVHGFIDDRTMFSYIEKKSSLNEGLADKGIRINGLERLDNVTENDNPIILIYHY
jgi:hypothetical protein